ncbi:sensor histidine kinase [Lachnoclostridium phytofermentans]|uniref:Histidine kinase internal region n=1 Tax=Lachnoclostridium phytofermentans (strain ATCC 700394 / DSM 18823 / ISDg) TaxID=357809 RepID=A9KJ94_LACP7|nr:histidine kinase [Lachnoclostridium phytofermentans]ABX42506.1 histidine kinase internal region [Lachnoclostridium phytofermentans ISDg]
MKRKRIRFFSDNIRHTFILYAIIPTFLIACLCLGLILGIWQYNVYATNRATNAKVSNVLQKVVDIYVNEALNLSKDVTLITEPINTDKLVDIRRSMYKLYAEAEYYAKLYILDEELNSVLSDNIRMPSFLIDNSCYDWGIIREIRENPQGISITLATEDGRILCIGTGIQNRDELIGYIIVTIPADEFRLLLTQVSQQTVITDENGWIYLSNNFVFQDALGRFVRDQKYSEGFIKYQEKGYYLSKSKICNNKLQVYTVTSHDMESKIFYTMCLFILSIFAAIIIITYFTSRKVAKKSTRDIYKIADAFEQVKKGDLERYLDINSSIEFKEIGEAYNLMLDGLKNNIKENKELTRHVAFAQVKQLEAQFNPHFLFNTLDNIRFMSKIDPEASDKMIVALSALLRYSISNAEEEIQVEEDIRYTESYLTILKIRFNRRFTYEIDIEDKVKKYIIPKLMIQSIIENAVKYGFAEEDTLHVTIRGFEKDGNLIFICKDNGGGMKEDLLKEIRENLLQPVNRTNHHGIYNIHRRIQLMYHGDYGVTLESKLGEGTVVTLTLPIHMHSEI